MGNVPSLTTFVDKISCIVDKVAEQEIITMAYIVSAKLRLLVLICIVGLFFGSASTQNRRPRRKSSLGTGRRRVMNSLDRSSLRGVSVYNVDKYGASGNGWSDDSTAFWAAWQGACTSALPSVFLVPEGKKYLVRPINFKGPCSAPGLTVLSFHVISVNV